MVDDLDAERQPVVVGVGQVRSNRDRSLDGAREPADLIIDALHRALADAGPAEALGRRIDAVDVVRVMSWVYDDLPRRVASAVGAAPAHAEHSDVGGNRPAELLDRAAARIAAGESDVAVVCGGEASSSLAAWMAAGQQPPWSQEPGGPMRVSAKDYASPLMLAYGLIDPVTTYPLYENALRAALGEGFEAAQRWSAEMLAAFSEAAAHNDAAWDPVVRTADEIRVPTERNRYIRWPYPLLMNAQGRVDQASAVLVTSLAMARELGVAEERLVHVWGGAGGADSTDVLARVAYDHSPALDAVLAATLDQAGITAADVDQFDFYSCFPVVPKLAGLALGLPRDARMSVTGGLNSFGGPSNNYSGHALVAMTRALRDSGGTGLVYANGEHLTKHHCVLLSRDAHPEGYVGGRTALTYDREGPHVVGDAEGRATVETFTVAFARDGAPERGWVLGRDGEGRRFPALVEAPATLAALCDPARQPVGEPGRVTRIGEHLDFALDGTR